jgi:periplasmic protein CpxP/Spy
MGNIRYLGVSIGVLGFTLLAAPLAQADPPSQPPHAAAQGHDEDDMQQQRRAHMERLAGLIHDALALRPDQEASWRTFTAAMAPPAGLMMPHDDEARDHAMTAPQMLDKMAERMHREQAEFERHASAVRQFYAVLSPTQQRTFDAFMILMHHGMGMHGGVEMHGMNMHEGRDDGSMMR